MTPRVLLLELNELAPPLMDRFIAAGELPCFARLRDESVCWITDADEAPEHLEPWIQWVTVHTGVGYDRHQVFKLGEGTKNEQPTLADVVGQAGGTVWLCGAMNVVPRHPVAGQHLPDPWSTEVPTVPRSLEAFGDFVRTNVQEHTNASARLSPRAALRFGVYLLRHGLSRRTVGAVGGQLVGERRGRHGRWRRAVLLDRFQWDVFRWHWRRARPQLATFFSNSTAHFQHMYWRQYEPEAFDIQPSAEEVAAFGDSIPEGYRCMDRLVGEAIDLADDDAFIVFCTALSQQPYLRMEEQGGKRFHRPYDLADVLARVGIGAVDQVAPVMAEQFHVYFTDDAAAEAGERRLAQVTVDGQPALSLRRSGRDVFVGCSLFHEVPDDALLSVAEGPVAPFAELFYRSEVAKSGMHHPDGMLWIRPPGGGSHRDAGRTSLRAVAPTVLHLLGLEPVESMTSPALVVSLPA